MDEKPFKAPQKRRWLRISLRTLLLLVTVIAVWLGVQTNRAMKQRRAVAKVQELGGRVWFDYQVKENPHGAALLAHPSERPQWPEWLIEIVGDAYFGNVVSINLDNTLAEDGDLEMLEGLSSVTHLTLSFTRVTDRGVERIVEIAPQLEQLDLWNTAVTDSAMPYIGQLTKLEWLGLCNTRISDESAQHLGSLTKMRTLILDGTQITDAALVHLGGMRELDDWLGLCCEGVTDSGIGRLSHLRKAREINLTKSRVTKHGAAWLSECLPGCRVSY